MTGRCRAAAAGFTLLELLVALVVCGMLFAGLSSGSHLVGYFADRQRVLLGSIDDLDAIDRTLRGLIEHIEPTGRLGLFHLDGNDQTLQFVTRLPARGDDAATMRAEVRLLVDGEHRLLLRWAPDPHVEQPNPAASQTVILQGVERIVISYRAAGPGQAWRSAWHDRASPLLIRVHIAFPAGDPRDWPDLVASPMLAPAGT